MKDELFADLLASAEEMVRIEKGEETPEPEHVHTFSEIDVKAIREATGLRQQDFAVAVGVSYDLVKSWETKRRQPTGAPRKLLLLLQANPFIINQLKQSKNGRHLHLPFFTLLLSCPAPALPALAARREWKARPVRWCQAPASRYGYPRYAAQSPALIPCR